VRYHLLQFVLMVRALLIFVDGLGIGMEDSRYNTMCRFPTQLFTRFQSHNRISRSHHRR
jgi:hypothetical protein